MNYEEALNYIHNIPRGNKKYNFDTLRRILDKFGNPHKKFKFIHIAGTNGKGSAASYISAVLSYASYKTGRFISPFIEKFNERISIDNTDISNDDIARLVTYMMPIIEENTSCDDILSEFEFVTVMAFLYFAEKECDYVVLECGMGGRYDATNVICADNVVASVIMKIDYDHMQFLGSTIEEIASHKCGIIKQNRPVVSYLGHDDKVKKIIEDSCLNTGSPLAFADKTTVHSRTFNETVFSCGSYDKIAISLLGIHQSENAAVALKVFEILNEKETHISEDAIRKGMMSAKNIGRFEVVSTSPLVILDGAHNSNGIDAFVDSAKEYLKHRKITIVAGMLADKDYPYAIKRISEITDNIIFTTVTSYRSALADTLAKSVCEGIKHTVTENPVDAVKLALDGAGKDDCICVIGSLYLMGEIRSLFKDTQD